MTGSASTLSTGASYMITSLLGYVSSSKPIFATAFSIESSISSTAAGIAETVCAFAMLGDGFEATNDTPV